MHRYRSAFHGAALCGALVLAAQAFAARADAAGSLELCQAVARHLWSSIATRPLHKQTPLAELAEAAPSAIKATESTSFARPGQSAADALAQDHAAPDALVKTLRNEPPTTVMRFGASALWLLDRVDGTLGCHTTRAVALPADGPAHEVPLPGSLDPSALCALSALTAISIGDAPALWIEQSGTFSNTLTQSTVMIAAVAEDGFQPPCGVVIDYTMTDRATHAFCDGIDCVPLIRIAELLAMRLRNDEPAASLSAGALPADRPGEAAAYGRMAELAKAGTQPAELPTFGVSLDSPYVTFTDTVTFPLRLDDGRLYLARLGHGGFGWRQNADTLLALYRLHDDRLVPAASVYVAARREGIAAVTVKEQ
jgi:hypothetical protein